MATPDTPAAAHRPGVIVWFRQDLRLHDQLALASAMALAERTGGWLLPVYVHDEQLHAATPWGFPRTGAHRLAWIDMAVQGLSAQLEKVGSRLIQLQGNPVQQLCDLVRALDDPWLVCEAIATPQEEDQVQALRQQGVDVHTVWQSTLMAPESLPFAPQDVPDQFTTFRQALERHRVRPTAPRPAPQVLPALPSEAALLRCRHLLAPTASATAVPPHPDPPDPRASFPWHQSAFHGTEQAALAHLAHYCARGLPHTYKATRNGLAGPDFSSKWSPWLATGALSARRAWAAIEAFESAQGANEGTGWLLFELLWRDHFRWLHLKHGRRLYRAQGLRNAPTPPAPPPHDPHAFERWRQARTGHPFIDAGLRELAASGYLSNRMRQNVASYLVHDLGCDWRAGAAWFEACLIDYDVYSNQGNWLYLSGRGTDPRPNRRFNPELQARNYDPDGAYQRLWSSA